MKIISLNLNGIRSAVRKGLIKWIAKQNADVICFQETKAQISQLNTIISSFENWHTSFSDAEKKGYSGVAIFSKKLPQSISKSFGFEEADREGEAAAQCMRAPCRRRKARSDAHSGAQASNTG